MIAEATPSLSDLASTINAEHEACAAAVRSALRHACNYGKALIAVKEQVEHGSFEAWITLNCHVSARQARNYMTLAANWDRITELSAKRKRASDLGLESLSVKAALRLLTEDSGGWKFVDKLCPACGERMVITSRHFFTCVACWDCRLYPNPKAASMTADPGGIQRGKRCREDFRRLADPFERAAVAVAVISMLDEESREEVARLLGKAKRSATERRAAEVLATLQSNPIAQQAVVKNE